MNQRAPDETSCIQILAFGSAAEVLGWQQRAFAWQPDLTAGQVLDALQVEFPSLQGARERLRLAINEQYATLASTLQSGDELALIPPIAGGDRTPVVCRLTAEPIDVPALQDEVRDPTCGACNVFVGTVRAEQSPSGQTLVGLEYSAYEPMAVREMEALCNEVAAEFSLHHVRLVHRVGKLGLEEAAVAIVTTAPHRGASFDGCRAIIEQLKQRVPIFKKELWGDGGHSWVEPEQP